MFHPYLCQSVVCFRCWWTEFCTTSLLILSDIPLFSGVLSIPSGSVNFFHQQYRHPFGWYTPLLGTPDWHPPGQEENIQWLVRNEGNGTWLEYLLFCTWIQWILLPHSCVECKRFFPNKDVYKPQMMKAKEFGSSKLTKNVQEKRLRVLREKPTGVRIFIIL